jgi:hypothetical protein
MNNIHAEIDEILRTRDKKTLVSIFLQMQLNYIRATEAEGRLTSIRGILEWECKLCQHKHRCDECVTKGLKDLAVTQSNTPKE